MPRKLEQASNQPIKAAARLAEIFANVPWPTVVFAECKDGVPLKTHTFKPGDPEVGRYRLNRRFVEVGTYTRGVSEPDLVADLTEAWSALQ